MHAAKMMDVEEALHSIRSGDIIITAMAAAEPQSFYHAIHRRCEHLKNIKIYCANPSQAYPIFSSSWDLSQVEVLPMFLTPSVRFHQKKSHIQYVPQNLSQWVRNLTASNPPDIFWGTCSYPDKKGYVSLGTSVCYEYELLKKAKKVFLEMNESVPFTYGSTAVSLDYVDGLIESQHEIPTLELEEPQQVDHDIAERIADLIPHGATLQLGIGAIPNALTKSLKNHQNLGVHTEMINDTMMQLMLSGAIDGSQKSLWPERIVGSFAYGSAELYRFVDRNPGVELHPASVVNDPYRIGRNHRMCSVNSAIEVDVTGQVCSESIGHLELSGVGGAADTHIGAQLSSDGRAIIAMRSQTRKGRSKITVTLQAGAKVSVSRNDVDTIITEYGVAALRGLSIRDRARAMIRIAHPSHRENLEFDAKACGYL
ncbi:MAG: acetyl-CoA hydrolase/transferase family protein [Oligoflexales bacterium]